MSHGTSQRRIFVVDDEIVIASTLALILRNYGFDTQSFSVPQEALQAALLTAPHLLISDVMMPGLSGIDLAIQIQKRDPHCKVLLFSGQASTRDMLEDARSNGHNFELLLKPVHPSELLEKVRNAMDEVRSSCSADAKSVGSIAGNL